MDAGGWPKNGRAIGLCSASEGSGGERSESDFADPINMASSEISAGRSGVLGAPNAPGFFQALVKRLQGGDEIARLVTLVFASSILLLTVLLVFELARNSALSWHKFGWKFFITRTWDPVFENFGALPFVYGTMVTSAVGLLIAVPLGVGGALFLAELAPPTLSSALTFVIELLAAIP